MNEQHTSKNKKELGYSHPVSHSTSPALCTRPRQEPGLPILLEGHVAVAPSHLLQSLHTKFTQHKENCYVYILSKISNKVVFTIPRSSVNYL